MANKRKRFFPLSSEGVYHYGLKNWIESNNCKINFTKNLQNNRKKILEIFKQIFFNNKDEYLKYVAICNYDLLDSILYISQFYEIFNNLEKKKIKRVFLKKNTNLHNTCIEKIIFKKYFDNSFINYDDIKSNYKIYIKNFISHLNSIILNKRKITIVYENDYINKLFPKKNYTYCYVNFRDNVVRIDEIKKNYLENKIYFFLKKTLKKNFDKFPIFIIEKIVQNFCQTYDFLKSDKINLPSKYFIPNLLGRNKMRAFAVKCLLNNAKLYGYIHGNQILNFEISKETFFYNNILSLGGRCYVGSRTEKQRVKEYLKKLPKPIRKVDFKISQNLYRKTNVNYTNNNRILLVGFPMSQDFYYWAPSFHTFNLLYVETSIIKLCKENNYEIDYKIHPERINETEKLYKKEKINIIYDPLEDILNNYEYVICPHPISTTFSYILYSSNAKVIIFDHKDLRWDKSVYKFIKKRAEVIKLYNNKINHMKFDKMKFLKSVKKIMSKDYKKNNYKINFQ